MSYHIYTFSNSPEPVEIACRTALADAKYEVSRRVEILVQSLRANNIAPIVLPGRVHGEQGDYVQIFAQNREGRKLYYAVAATERTLVP